MYIHTSHKCNNSFKIWGTFVFVVVLDNFKKWFLQLFNIYFTATPNTVKVNNSFLFTCFKKCFGVPVQIHTPESSANKSFIFSKDLVFTTNLQLWSTIVGFELQFFSSGQLYNMDSVSSSFFWSLLVQSFLDFVHSKTGNSVCPFQYTFEL